MSQADDAGVIWDAIKAQPIAMFTTLHEGKVVSRPMSGHADREAGAIYFVTQLDSLKTDDVEREDSVNLAYAQPDKSTWVSLAGTATVSQDRARLRELWSIWAEAWLPDGPDSPDTALITVRPIDAVIWDNQNSKIVRTVKTLAAVVRQTPPDPGRVQKVEL